MRDVLVVEIGSRRAESCPRKLVDRLGQSEAAFALQLGHLLGDVVVKVLVVLIDAASRHHDVRMGASRCRASLADAPVCFHSQFAEGPTSESRCNRCLS